MTTLQDEIRNSMSPQAVALIVAHLHAVIGISAAAKEAQWFTAQLVELVGGPDELNELFEEVGV